jgi:hypothetical protein
MAAPLMQFSLDQGQCVSLLEDVKFMLYKNDRQTVQCGAV